MKEQIQAQAPMDSGSGGEGAAAATATAPSAAAAAGAASASASTGTTPASSHRRHTAGGDVGGGDATHARARRLLNSTDVRLM